jgi:hypothetical protein
MLTHSTLSEAPPGARVLLGSPLHNREVRGRERAGPAARLSSLPLPLPWGHPFAYLARGVELELDYRDISFLAYAPLQMPHPSELL